MKIVWGDIAVVVADAQQSAAWWKQKCGFEIRDNAGHWITVAPPGTNGIVLHLCAGEGYPAETGNTGIGFYVDDVAEIEKAWTKKGVIFTKSRTQTPASVQAKFLDLDGHEYWLFEDSDLRVDAKGAKEAKGAKRVAAKPRPSPRPKPKPKPVAKKARRTSSSRGRTASRSRR
ncbi:MAG TPA: VOC family protein [Candidatus Thermoplasmatota archaeon]|nr:VOC family protein [Candidatus Thermoplasmatota archaeon]